LKESVEKILYSGTQKAGISLSSGEIELFKIYLMELKKWSSKINITSLRKDMEIVIKHFVDSLFPVRHIPQGSFVLDIGSGGGFPGIPLKIAAPSLYVTLLDSTLKKVNFQKHIIRLLQLNGIRALHGRAENKDLYEEMGSSFDVVISRAFSDLGGFLSIGEPYLRRGGLLIAMRGREVRQELAENDKVLVRLRLRVVDVVEFHLPYLYEKRSLVLFSYI